MLLFMGLCAGTLGVMVGAGGGIIIVPVMLLSSELDSPVIAGTALALVSVNSIFGTLSYRSLGLLDVRSGILFAAAAIPGSVIAPFAVAALDPNFFRAILAILILTLAAHMLIRNGDLQVDSSGTTTGWLSGGATRAKRNIEFNGMVYKYEFNQFLAIGFNGILGFVSAFLGTGGGFIRTPVLVTIFAFPVRVAVATSILSLSIYATIGASVHAIIGHVDWYPTFLWAAIGFVVGSQLGTKLSTKLPIIWIDKLLSAMLLAMGVGLLVQVTGVW